MIIVSIALFLGGIILLINRRARNVSVMLDFNKSIQLVGALKNLLVQIQKHRGLTTAYLDGGEEEFIPAIRDKRSLADKIWVSLVSDNPSLIEDSLYLGIKDHWERLKKRWPNRSVDNNIEQHNRLILNLMRLIESQEEDNILFVELLREQGLDLSWKTLLETIEMLGQIRAIGTGIVSSGKSKVLERNKMMFLVERVDGQLNKISDSFEQSSMANNSDEIRHYLILSTKKSNMLCALIVEKFEKPRIQDLSANQFFDLASTAIESLSSLFDCVILALQREALLCNSWSIYPRKITLLKPSDIFNSG